MTTTETKTAKDYGQPEWLPVPISPNDIAAILQCEEQHRKFPHPDDQPLDSGCYMPAVEYYTAAQVMAEHGDAVIEYLLERTGRIPIPNMRKVSWAQLPCWYLSRAVLEFAKGYRHAADWENEEPISLTD